MTKQMPCPRCKGAGTIECASISEVMVAKRASLGLSLRSVECQAGVSISTVSRVENGGGADWTTMVKLAKFYEISLDALAELPVFSVGIPEAESEMEVSK